MDAEHFSLTDIKDNETTLRISGVIIAVLLKVGNIKTHFGLTPRFNIRRTVSHGLPLVIARATHSELLSVLNDGPSDSVENTHFVWTCTYSGTSTTQLFPKHPRGGIIIPEVDIAVLRNLRDGDILLRIFEGWFVVLRQYGSDDWVYIGSASIPEGDDVDWPQALWTDETKWEDFVIH